MKDIREGRDIVITKAAPEDAMEILILFKVCGGETDNLTFGSEGIPVSVEAEAGYIKSINEPGSRDVFLTARLDGKIVGTGSFVITKRNRMDHRGEIGVSVRKSAWGLGVGSRLMEALLDFAKNSAKADVAALEVRCDNERAIRLYERFGFRKTGSLGGYFKIDGKLIDFFLMERRL